MDDQLNDEVPGNKLEQLKKNVISHSYTSYAAGMRKW